MSLKAFSSSFITKFIFLKRVFGDTPFHLSDILMSGNHKLIDQWRHEQAVKRTEERRPDLLKGKN